MGGRTKCMMNIRKFVENIQYMSLEINSWKSLLRYASVSRSAFMCIGNEFYSMRCFMFLSMFLSMFVR